MIRWIVESSMKLRYLIIIFAVMLIVVGLMQLSKMPVDIFPEIDPPYVEVQTEALGLSAEEVEAFITVPMEADLLNGVAWLDQISSKSVAGLSSILLTFEPGTDPIRARQMVQERLTQAHALPNVSQPPVMLQPLSSTNRVAMVGLTSDQLSLIEMGVLARWVIKPRLLGVPEVANVAIWGQRERQLQVQVDPQKLHEEEVTLQQIIETTGEALWVSPLSYLESSSPGTAGWIDTPNQRLSVRHLLPISTPDDLAKVTIIDRQDLILGDVATVVEDHQPLIGDAALTDGPGLMLVIEKFPGANTLEVTRGVEKALKELQPGLQGINIDTKLFRPANYIEMTVDNLSTIVVVGAVLLALVFLFFFFSWRTALISLVTIPLSLIAAGLVLSLRGATFNIMILTGLVIALCIVIDDGVIYVENIARRLGRSRPKEREISPHSVILDAVIEMRAPLGFTLLIILLVVLPILFLPGLLGPLIQPVVVSFFLAVLSSLAVALIVTPALSVTLLSHSIGEQPSSPIIKRLQPLYKNLLLRILHRPYLALVVAAIFILAGLLALPFLQVTQLPILQQPDLLIDLEAMPGTSRPAMTRIIAQVSSELQAVPGIKNLGSHVGRAITGDAVVGINSGEIWVSLDPAADYKTTVAALQEVVDGYPGLEWEVQTYQPEKIVQGSSGAEEEDITVRVYGGELDVLRQEAEAVVLALQDINGLVDVQADLYPEEPQVEIEVNLSKAEQFGIKPGDVRRQATTLLSGIQVGSLFEEQKVFDVIVWGVPELRKSLTDIRNLLIDLPNGDQVALGEIADVRIAPVATVIERQAVSRFIDVNATVTGRSVDSVKAEIESTIQGKALPFEYHVEVLSATQGLHANQQRLITIAIAVLIGVYLLMQAAFSSWRLAFIIFITLPMALVGGVLAALIFEGGLSISSIFGFVAVFSLALRNGMVQINHFQHLEKYEREAFRPELVLRGTRERLSPILMTTMATGLFLLPLLAAGDIAGTEIIRPIAVVIMGGLFTSALLNLFIVPTLYLRWPSDALATAKVRSGDESALKVA